jgi:hypothetical protein
MCGPGSFSRVGSTLPAVKAPCRPNDRHRLLRNLGPALTASLPWPEHHNLGGRDYGRTTIPAGLSPWLGLKQLAPPAGIFWGGQLFPGVPGGGGPPWEWWSARLCSRPIWHRGSFLLFFVGDRAPLVLLACELPTVVAPPFDLPGRDAGLCHEVQQHVLKSQGLHAIPDQ